MKIVRYISGAIVLGIIAVIELMYGRRFETRERKEQAARINILWNEWMRSVRGSEKQRERTARALKEAQCEYARGKNWKEE